MVVDLRIGVMEFSVDANKVSRGGKEILLQGLRSAFTSLISGRK